MEKKHSDKKILELLASGNKIALKHIIDQYGLGLMKKAFYYLKDRGQAEDICQEVYKSIWEKRADISVTTSLNGYLSTMVRNKSLNFLKRQSRLTLESEDSLATMGSGYTNSQQNIEVKEMEAKIREIVANLPEKCRIVFEMSRFDEMTNQEIANELGKSVKTIENQMSRALKELREKMNDEYPHLKLLTGFVGLFTFMPFGIGAL